MPNLTTLTDSQMSTLSNLCAIAAQQFKDNATMLRRLEVEATKDEAGLLPTGAEAGRLAEQFEAQIKEAQEFANLFAEADLITVEYTQGEDTA